MILHFIDILIIGLNLAATVFIGVLDLISCRKKYPKLLFLGGNKIRWYYLGLSYGIKRG